MEGNKMKYKAEVKVVNEDKWHSNALTFDSKKEAEEYARDLHYRWTATTDWRVKEVEESNDK